MDQLAYVRHLEQKLRLAKRQTDAAQDANIVLSVACMALVLMLAIISSAV